MERKRYSIEISKGNKAELLRMFLKAARYKYEASEAGEYIHFSMDLTDAEYDITNIFIGYLDL